MGFFLANSFEGHHLGLLPFIALATLLVLIIGAVAAGGCGIRHVLQGPLFPVVYEFHERISMVPWGISSLTTPPLFYLPCRERMLNERYVGLREQRLHQVGLPGLRNVATYESIILKQLLIF